MRQSLCFQSIPASSSWMHTALRITRAGPPAVGVVCCWWSLVRCSGRCGRGMSQYMMLSRPAPPSALPSFKLASIRTREGPEVGVEVVDVAQAVAAQREGVRVGPEAVLPAVEGVLFQGVESGWGRTWMVRVATTYRRTDVDVYVLDRKVDRLALGLAFL